MKVEVFDDQPCILGEGPLWHPERAQLFWFDIISKRLYTREGAERRHWSFDEHVSAAGWVDRERLLVASESALLLLDLESGRTERLVPLEADDPTTRSNDGRADPYGGFWIGTMGKRAEPGKGAIYRYYRGIVRRLHAPITISNAICFSPDAGHAYFTDTAKGQIMRQRLDGEGWPLGEPEVFVDCAAAGLKPDGAVVDEQGRLWNAQWGGSRITAYGPDGEVAHTIMLPASQITCPAFGGPDRSWLYATSAREGLSGEDLLHQPQAGMTFVMPVEATGQAEHRVVL